MNHLAIGQSYKDGLTIKECAAAYNTSTGTIRRSLDKQGIPTRDRQGNIKPNRNTMLVQKPAATETRIEILDLVKKSCRKLGGMAEIGEGFVVVDTSKFEISEK